MQHDQKRLFASANPLIANVHEARHILNDQLRPVREIAESISRMFESVVITDGASGAWVRDLNGLQHIPSPKVEAVDTTGAGDMFAGVLAAQLADGAPLTDAVEAAVARASAVVSVSRSER